MQIQIVNREQRLISVYRYSTCRRRVSGKIEIEASVLPTCVDASLIKSIRRVGVDAEEMVSVSKWCDCERPEYTSTIDLIDWTEIRYVVETPEEMNKKIKRAGYTKVD